VRISRRNLLLASALRTWAQEVKFSADVNVVTLFATVRDKDGAIVNDLTREDFALQEDGAPQTIRYFSRESDLPLTIGLLVDTSRSQISVLEPERRASYVFLDRVLREGTDQACVVHFDTQVEVLQDFTSSRKELGAALDRLAIPGRVATLFYDAIRLSSEDLMKKLPGRKALMVLTDGVDYRGKTSLEEAIEYAQRADTIVYSIRFADSIRLHRPAVAAAQAILSERGKRAMERIARETGGAYFQVSKSDPIGKIYARIEDTLRNQYSLGYTPARTDANGKYRKIKLTATQKNLVVQTRDGYYPK